MIQGMPDKMFQIELYLPKGCFHFLGDPCFLPGHFAMMIDLADLVLGCQLRNDL